MTKNQWNDYKHRKVNISICVDPSKVIVHDEDDGKLMLVSFHNEADRLTAEDKVALVCRMFTHPEASQGERHGTA